MIELTGKIKKIIYENDTNGYLVAIFAVTKYPDEYKDVVNKNITITGTFVDIKISTNMKLIGEFNYHDKYGEQFVVSEYEYIMPTTKDDILEFLASPFIKGCGKKTAEKIVKIYGDNSIEIIKNDINALDKIEGISILSKRKIYDSINNYSKVSDLILKLKNMGFTIDEAGKIIAKYKDDTKDIINNNVYLLSDLFDFDRIDAIFLNNYSDKYDERRIKACILEVLKSYSFNTGNVYGSISDIYNLLNNSFNISLNYEIYINYLDDLSKELLVLVENDNVYLIDNYEDEYTIANLLKSINDNKIIKKNYKDEIKELENILNITYNDDQKNAIEEALNNNITIISGGPGTGKTTLINAIVKLYIKENNYSNLDILENIALLAPTGRAAKKMSVSTNLPASTIHRYLKWNKDTDEFMVNENNKNFQQLIIVDEVSMIDTNLFASLLKGLNTNIKLILVGDKYQLPSVGSGSVLKDLISSDLFLYIELKYIYRQSDNSYIPYLAKDIKNKDLQEEFINKHDDYNFLMVDSNNIVNTIIRIVDEGIKKGYDENKLQILAPIYKGEYGIDNLNKLLCNIFNPLNNQKCITYGNTLYKEDDKVLQLVNDADNNVFNGDIGYIKSINTIKGKDIIKIDYDGNIVIYNKKDLKNIKHGYAISIHKSQGSEFDHVIMPITYHYGHMLYNKLLYTGVSRAKKSLILIGDPKVFYRGVLNDYSEERKTTLKSRLEEIFYT